MAILGKTTTPSDLGRASDSSKSEFVQTTVQTAPLFHAQQSTAGDRTLCGAPDKSRRVLIRTCRVRCLRWSRKLASQRDDTNCHARVASGEAFTCMVTHPTATDASAGEVLGLQT